MSVSIIAEGFEDQATAILISIKQDYDWQHLQTSMTWMNQFQLCFEAIPTCGLKVAKP